MSLNIFLTIKDAAKFLNDYATLILVIITGIYAYFTYKMAKIMGKQVIADIQVSNMILGSTFAGRWFKEYSEKQPDKISEDYYCEFKLLFDIRNKNSGSGCIDKPNLILKFKNDGFQYLIPPTTKSTKWIPNPNNLNIQTGEVTDYGGTIYLRGGESQKIELEYATFLKHELLKHIKESLNSMEYNIEFADNLGKNYLLKINDVRDEEKVERS
jgi:hypothetical protein